MAKFYGLIGYAETIETEPGLWIEKIVEKPYSGDTISNFRNLQNSGEVNDNIRIIADSIESETDTVGVVDRQFSDITGFTANTSATSKKCVAMSEELFEQVERLYQIVGRFKI